MKTNTATATATTTATMKGAWIAWAAVVAGLAAAALGARDARAAGFAVAQQNSVSAGTAGAGAARPDDPGAAWHNPAALADGGGWRFGLSMVFAHPSLQARAMDGSWTTDSESRWATPPHLDLSYAEGRFAAGVSVGVPFGSGVSWPSDWPGRHEIVRSQLEVFRVAPFVAWQFGDWRVSGGLHLDAGRLRVGRQLDFIDVEGDVAIDMDGRGLGFHAAVFWAGHPEWTAGLAYRSRSSIDFSGGANFTAPDAFSEKTADQNASATMTMPDQLVLGGRWARGAWAAVADLELTLWSVNDKLVIDFVNEQTPDATSDNGWHSTLALRGGGEWKRGKLVVRAGAYFDPTPSPDDKLAPSSPDSSRIGLTAGASYALSSTFSVDSFAENIFLMRRESQNMEALAASYGGTAQVFGLGLRWSR